MALKQETTLTRSLAPEEIRPGAYVAVRSHIAEFLILGCHDESWRKLEIQRFEFLPWDEFTPLKVKAVCLPFVLVKQPGGTFTTVDVRRYRLGELSESFGKLAFDRYRRACKPKRTRKRRSKRKPK